MCTLVPLVLRFALAGNLALDGVAAVFFAFSYSLSLVGATAAALADSSGYAWYVGNRSSSQMPSAPQTVGCKQPQLLAALMCRVGTFYNSFLCTKRAPEAIRAVGGRSALLPLNIDEIVWLVITFLAKLFVDASFGADMTRAS